MININIVYFSIKISFIKKMKPSPSLGRLSKNLELIIVGLNSSNIVSFLMMDKNLHFKLALQRKDNFQN